MNEIKQEDEIYCPECGKAIKRNAVICVNCGIQIKPLNEKTETAVNKNKVNPKVKSSAIILVILFGFFGWLYIYQRSVAKFWIALGVTIFLVLISSFLSYFIYVFSIGIWIWALIDVSTKSDSFYKEYPNG